MEALLLVPAPAAIPLKEPFAGPLRRPLHGPSLRSPAGSSRAAAAAAPTCAGAVACVAARSTPAPSRVRWRAGGAASQANCTAMAREGGDQLYF
eukprot:6046561-Pleurochrysis_carterae.AAC.1